MRNPNRIDPFLNQIGKLWKENCPDWRFGQLIENVFCDSEYLTWFVEEKTMLDIFKRYFKGNYRRKVPYPTHYILEYGSNWTKFSRYIDVSIIILESLYGRNN
jgi:hypothetical protein